MPAKYPHFVLFMATVLFALGLSVACSTVATETSANPTPTSLIPIVTPVPTELRTTQRAQPVTTRTQVPSPTPYIISPTTPRPTGMVVIAPSPIPTLQVIALPTPQVIMITLPPPIPTFEPLPTIRLAVVALPTFPPLSPDPTATPTPLERAYRESGESLHAPRQSGLIWLDGSHWEDGVSHTMPEIPLPSGAPLKPYLTCIQREALLIAAFPEGEDVDTWHMGPRADEIGDEWSQNFAKLLWSDQIGALEWLEQNPFEADCGRLMTVAPSLDQEVIQFARACAEIVDVASFTRNEVSRAEYLLQEWELLEPPAGAEGYHAAVAALYRRWHETGVLDTESAEARKIGRAALSMPEGIVRTLQATGCLVKPDEQ